MSTTSLRYKSCGHSNCQLDIPTCCECCDQREHRPDPNSYPIYVDGQGWQDAGARWHNYCPGCRNVFEPLIAFEDEPSTSASANIVGRHASRRRRAQHDQPSLIAPSIYLNPSYQRLQHAPATKICGHHQCELTISTCCACTDTRPYSEFYDVYVDGAGWSNTGTRDHHYCPPCRVTPVPVAHAPTTLQALHSPLGALWTRTLYSSLSATFRNVSMTFSTCSRCTTSHPLRLRDEEDFMIDNACKLCYAAHANTVFTPCNHLVCCVACATLVMKDMNGDAPRCPICRGMAYKYLIIYRA